MKTKKLVVFDLDGTLNQAHLFTIRSHLETLKHFGVTDVSEEQLYMTLGEQYVRYCRQLMPGRSEAEYEQYRKMQQHREAVNRVGHHASYPHTVEMLETLKSQHYMTAICTNASQAYGHEIAQLLGFDHLIDRVQGYMEGHSKAASLAQLMSDTGAKTVMVGDRVFDLEAARQNRVPFIGCLYGYRPEEMDSADIRVQTPLEIPGAVEALIG